MNSANEGSESLSALAESIVAKARKLRPSARQARRRAVAVGSQSGGLDQVQAAAELASLAAAALQLSVQQARAAGRTWQEIGELLGVSRQAAFQRFGRPADPRTGDEMHKAGLPGAGQAAADVLADWAGGRLAEIVARFDDVMTARLPELQLASAWAQVIGIAGEYRRMGEPVVLQAGDYTVADIPLFFAAALLKGRVTFNASGQVAGLFVTKSDEP